MRKVEKELLSLASEIEKVFGDDPPPPVDVALRRPHAVERGHALRAVLTKRWRSIEIDDLEIDSESLLWCLSPTGVVYYLPAYMRLVCLSSTDTSDLQGHLLCQLCSDEQLRSPGRFNSVWKNLKPDQIECFHSLLVLLVEEGEGYEDIYRDELERFGSKLLPGGQ